MGRRPPRCKHCDEPIEFGINEDNGRRIPLNVGVDPEGSVLRTGATAWDGAPIVRLYEDATMAMNAGVDRNRYSLHRLTCQP